MIPVHNSKFTNISKELKKNSCKKVFDEDLDKSINAQINMDNDI